MKFDTGLLFMILGLLLSWSYRGQEKDKDDAEARIMEEYGDGFVG